MKLYLLIMLTFIISCSSVVKKKQSAYEYDSEKEVDIPAWVYAINDECNSVKYLCASSEGESLEEADIKSKKSLASILQVKIKASSQIKRFGLTSLESKGLEESIELEVKEEINVLLNGVKILNRFKKDKAYYSYAVLDKKNAVKIIKDKIASIDAKLISLYTQKRRIYVNRLLSLLTKRNAYKSEVHILDGNVKRSPVSFQNIYALKQDSKDTTNISIQAGNDIPMSLIKRLEQELTSMGFVISTKGGDSILKINFFTKEEYLNVKGFKKYAFVLNLESFDTQMVKRGLVSIKNISSGRNQKDALSSVLERIVKKMKIDIDQLNI